MPASRILPIGTWIIRQAPGSDVGFTIETFDAAPISSLGSQVPLGRAAHPGRERPSCVFFASGRLSSCCSDEVLVPIGGRPCQATPGPPRLPSG
jgi:hypothetical protein